MKTQSSTASSSAALGVACAVAAAALFSTAGLITLPVLGRAMWNDLSGMVTQWRVWLLVSVLAGTPFGLLMFGALQLAPSSHAAIFPFAAMSVMGTPRSDELMTVHLPVPFWPAVSRIRSTKG